MKYLFFLFSLLLYAPTFACLNNYSVYKEHHNGLGESLNKVVPQTITQRKIVADLKALEKDLDQKYSYKLHSDYGVLLLKFGKYAEGLKIFKQLIQQKPNEYQIIQNLGTAYELNGQLDSALFYIKKGLKINPNSHNRSEWIHVKILEAEIASKKDPNYLKKHPTLLGLHTQPYANKNDTELLKWSRDTLRQILHQLDERVPFSPRPNAIMSAVYYELGKYYYHFDDVTAYNCLQISLWYGSANELIVEKELLTATKYLQKRDKKYFKYPETVTFTEYPSFMIDSGFHYTPQKFGEIYPTENQTSNSTIIWLISAAALLIAVVLVIVKRVNDV